jgi:putative peptide zinc metalloprotease protein
MTAGTNAPELNGDSTVQVGRLAYRCEHDCWTVASLETGDAIDVPAIAITVLRALERGQTIGTAADIAEQAHGARPDVCGFVTDLAELGFVRMPGTGPAFAGDGLADDSSSLRWLAARHVSWVFYPLTTVVGAAFVICAFSVAAAVGKLDLSYRAIFISSHPGLVLLWSAAVVAATATPHEFCHLAAARAAAIPARISLSTRLIFLTAQTAAPLLWLASRRERFRFYIAGMACNLVLAAGCAVVEICCRRGTMPSVMAISAMLMLLLGVASEFEFYMRTDVYLIVQELTRCRNLFGDARAYARYRADLLRARFCHGARPADPTADLPESERRPVRAYCALMVLGSAIALILAAAYGLPISIVMYARAARELLSAQPLQVLDGATTFVIEGGLQLLVVWLLARHWMQRRGGLPITHNGTAGSW